MLKSGEITGRVQTSGPALAAALRGLGCCFSRGLLFHPPPLSSCFPPEFLPLRRWAEFHTGLDAPFVGFVST